MNDNAPDEPNQIVTDLAQRLFDEAGAFIEERGGITGAEVGEAIGYLINAGSEALDCEGCRLAYTMRSSDTSPISKR